MSYFPNVSCPEPSPGSVATFPQGTSLKWNSSRMATLSPDNQTWVHLLYLVTCNVCPGINDVLYKRLFLQYWIYLIFGFFRIILIVRRRYSAKSAKNCRTSKQRSIYFDLVACSISPFINGVLHIWLTFRKLHNCINGQQYLSACLDACVVLLVTLQSLVDNISQEQRVKLSEWATVKLSAAAFIAKWNLFSADETSCQNNCTIRHTDTKEQRF